MGYRSALEAAGAVVRDFKKFGSYSGDWWAFLGNGKFIHGSYGSCSDCDAFEAEFDWDGASCDLHYEFQEDCVDCQEAMDNYERRMADFGRSYLHHDFTQEEAEAYAEKDLSWDLHAQEMLDWIISKRGR